MTLFDLMSDYYIKMKSNKKNVFRFTRKSKGKKDVNKILQLGRLGYSMNTFMLINFPSTTPNTL